VGVLKGKIKRWAQHLTSDPAMFKASTWQRVVESSLQELMAGAQPDAPRYVKGSIGQVAQLCQDSCSG
jgi:hypothetical protein